MGSLSDYAEIALLDHVFNSAYTPVATIHLALCTADPTDAGTGATMNECANANGYARTAITFDAPASRAVQQAAIVTFPQASGGGWGTVTHWAVMDGTVEGADDVLAHGAFTVSKTINDGNTPSVAASEIDVTFSANEISTFLAEEFLDLMFRNQAYPTPNATIHVALTTVIITDGMTGSTITEPGSNYARKPETGWDAAAAGLVDNTAEIAFVTATGDWTTITSVAIVDALTLGNLLFYDNTMGDQQVDNGDTAKFPAGDLDITMD